MMSKYDLLNAYLDSQYESRIILCMEQMEKIIGDQLPLSAYRYVEWWSNSRTKAHPHSRAWQDAGYRTVNVKDTIFDQKITFEKIQ